jgi:hypothetical protein
VADAHVIRLHPARTLRAAPSPTNSRPLVHAWREAVWSSALSATDKLVALVYADHTGNGALRVWVTPDRLQERTSLGRTATTAAVRRLRAAGWLTQTSEGRRGSVTRYSLTVPDGVTLTDPQDPEWMSAPDTSPRGQVSPDGGLVSPRDERGSAGDPDPLPDPLPQPTNAPEPVDVAPGRGEPGDGMVATITAHRLAVGLTATAARTHAAALTTAGWTPDVLRRELDAQDWTGARGPGLLRHRLTALATTGPARPATAAPRDTTTQDRLRDDAAHAATHPARPDTIAAIRAQAASAAASARARVTVGLRSAA